MQNSFLPKVKMVAVAELKKAGFNPPKRTDQPRLKDLCDAIRRLGGIVQPLIIANDYRIIDGHRRAAAADMLKIMEVPCIVVPISLQEGWSTLNSSQKNITGHDWLYIYHIGVELENLPKKKQREIRRIEDLLGKEAIEMLVAKGMTTTVLSWARKVARYISNLEGRQQPNHNTLAMCLRWLIDQNQQYAARTAMERQMDRDVLRYAIEKNRKIAAVERTP